MKKLALLILISFLSAGTTAIINEAKAQDIAEQPCDPKFYKQMQSRAWLESEREIMQNQNLIFKADSVLEYTCFDLFANQAAWSAGDIFSHTSYFGAPIIERGADNALEVKLQQVIMNSLALYQADNYFHDFLGGRGLEVDLDPPNRLIYDGEQAALPIIQDGPLPYACNIMAKVWEKSKCLNFVHNERFETTDGYYPLDTLIGIDGDRIPGYNEISDVRQFPFGMECPAGDMAERFIDEIIIAENYDEEAGYYYQTPLKLIFEDVAKRTAPGECTAAIETGVEIILSTGPTGRPDGVCSNPGCTYTGGSCI